MGGAPTPDSSHQCPGPTAPAYQRRRRQPRSASAGGSGPLAGSTPAWLHPGLARWPGVQLLPTADLEYPPRYAAYVPSPSCPRRSPEAPFFRGLYALAVDNRPAGTGLAAQGLPDPGEQGVMDSRPGSIPPPNPEVVVDQLPRWQVVGQQTPGTAGSQHIPDGIHHLPAGILGWTATRLDRGYQGFQNPPLGIRHICGINCSVHGPSLRPPLQSCLAISSLFLNTF